MNFDVVIGNPPYQQSDGGHGASAKAIYNEFVEKAKEWEPDILSFVIPARWTAGGKGMTKFRKNMLNDNSIEFLKIFPNSKDCFPDNDIKGGICYFVRNANYEGKGRGVVKTDNSITEHIRSLAENGEEIFVINKISSDIIAKVRSVDAKNLMDTVSPSKPFGLRSSFKSEKKKPFQGSVKMYQIRDISYVDKKDIPTKHEWIDDYKVLIPKASDGRGGMNLQVLGSPIVAAPNSACTETYLIVNRYDNLKEAENMATFLKTKFARFMVSIVKKTQNGSKSVFRFVPQLDMNKEWLDNELYERYNLTQDEIDFIEKKIKVMA